MSTSSPLTTTTDIIQRLQKEKNTINSYFTMDEPNNVLSIFSSSMDKTNKVKIPRRVVYLQFSYKKFNELIIEI